MILSKIFFITGGFLLLALGIAGIVLPILPATPFLLGAAFCFMKSSGRLYRWIMNHKYFGPRIRRIGEAGLTLREKISIYALVFAMLLPVIILSPSLHLRIFLIVLLAVKAFVFIRIKTARGGAIQTETVQSEREPTENTDVK
ncbi:MAG: YbaN family protein [Treponema sp.]|nr:YbaN family protein [Treponema sp.]